MRRPMKASGSFTPQPPARTPHRSALRLPAARLCCPGATPGPRASCSAGLRASGADPGTMEDDLFAGLDGR